MQRRINATVRSAAARGRAARESPVPDAAPARVTMLVCVAACEPARLMRAVVLTQRAPRRGAALDLPDWCVRAALNLSRYRDSSPSRSSGLAETPGLPAPSFSVALGGFPAGVHRQHADSPADNARPALFGHGGPLAPRIPGERRRWAAGASIALRPVVPRSARAGSGRPPRRRARRDAGPRSPAPTRS